MNVAPIVAASLLIASAAAAQAQPRVPIRPIPIPNPPVTPLDPRGNEDRLRPQQPQTTLPVERFDVTGRNCSADLGTVHFVVNAILAVQNTPNNAGRVSIEVLVNGVSAGSETLTIRNGRVDVSHRVSTPAAGAPQEIVFVLDGAVRSAPQLTRQACVSLAPSGPPPVLTLPNLAFGPVIYGAMRGPSFAGNQTEGPLRTSLWRATEGRLPLGQPLSLRGVSCSGESAGTVATFAVALAPVRIDNPLEYVTFSIDRGRNGEPRLVDTRDGARWATGEAVGSVDDIRGTPLPAGHQWLIFSTNLPCGVSGSFDVLLDGGSGPGRLRETSETDNRLTIRYTTP